MTKYLSKLFILTVVFVSLFSGNAFAFDKEDYYSALFGSYSFDKKIRIDSVEETYYEEEDSVQLVICTKEQIHRDFECSSNTVTPLNKDFKVFGIHHLDILTYAVSSTNVIVIPEEVFMYPGTRVYLLDFFSSLEFSQPSEDTNRLYLNDLDSIYFSLGIIFTGVLVAFLYFRLDLKLSLKKRLHTLLLTLERKFSFISVPLVELYLLLSILFLIYLAISIILSLKDTGIVDPLYILEFRNTLSLNGFSEFGFFVLGSEILITLTIILIVLFTFVELFKFSSLTFPKKLLKNPLLVKIVLLNATLIAASIYKQKISLVVFVLIVLFIKVSLTQSAEKKISRLKASFYLGITLMSTLLFLGVNLNHGFDVRYYEDLGDTSARYIQLPIKFVLKNNIYLRPFVVNSPLEPIYANSYLINYPNFTYIYNSNIRSFSSRGNFVLTNVLDNDFIRLISNENFLEREVFLSDSPSEFMFFIADKKYGKKDTVNMKISIDCTEKVSDFKLKLISHYFDGITSQVYLDDSVVFYFTGCGNSSSKSYSFEIPSNLVSSSSKILKLDNLPFSNINSVEFTDANGPIDYRFLSFDSGAKVNFVRIANSLSDEVSNYSSAIEDVPFNITFKDTVDLANNINVLIEEGKLSSFFEIWSPLEFFWLELGKK